MLHTPIRGFHDILTDESPRWRAIENILINHVNRANYQEVRLPILERTELFHRSVGMNTDIVGKEMYTFTDRNDESISLRPEATASCMRALSNAGMLHNKCQKVWYCGPMFRRERPQKGRLRQFHQFGVECIGVPSLLADVELLSLTHTLLQTLPLQSDLRLEINFLASSETRKRFTDVFKLYLKANESKLDEDSVRRIDSNPLRVFDSKIDSTQEVLANAPTLADFYTAEEENDFLQIQKNLEYLGIPFIVQPRLVRGLDYYNGLVYEWTTTELGAQSTVCAGGRYDNLSVQLGIKPINATGFSIGLERLMLLCTPPKVKKTTHLYLIAMSAEHWKQTVNLMQHLHQKTSIRIELDTGLGSMKSMMKRADRSKADYACILGDEEIQKSQFTLKPLRTQHPEKIYHLEGLIDYFNKEENDYETK